MKQGAQFLIARMTKGEVDGYRFTDEDKEIGVYVRIEELIGETIKGPFESEDAAREWLFSNYDVQGERDGTVFYGERRPA